MNEPETRPQGRQVLLYDAFCRFCRFAARTVVRLDRHERIALLPFDHAEAMLLLADVPDDARTGSMHLVDSDGGRFSRGAALTRLITHLGAPGTARVLGHAYEPIARHRCRLGRFVPNGPAPRRYP